MQFIKAKFPKNPELLQLVPVDYKQYKGYFPAGKICKVFGEQFKTWKKKLGRPKHQKMINLIIGRLAKEG